MAQRRRNAVGNGNGNGVFARLVDMAPVIGGVMMVAFSIVIWMVKTNSEFEARIHSLEVSQQSQDKRIDYMDSNGTHRVQLIEERVAELKRRQEALQDELLKMRRGSGP